jgi:hypothetical protein
MTDTRTLTVTVRHNYGVATVYPACKQSSLFCAIARTKTLTDEMVRLLEANGYTLTVAAPALPMRGAR